MPEIPAIFKHMENMYNELEDRATPFDTVDNGAIMKFEGSKVEAFRALGVSQGYYTKIFDSLTEMGCIEQVHRGSGGQPSVILLHKPPVFDEYTSIYQGRLTRPTGLDTIRQQMKDLQRRLGGIDLNSLFLSVHERLESIEARLDELERPGR